jgi:uncharacterized protein (TIGR02453 family)
VTQAGFRGWPATAIPFFEGLEAENTKVYWTANNGIYERDVKAPMLALLEALAEEFGTAKLFRPYRDTRFSRDKSPYKTSIAATIGSGYVHLSSEGLMAGAGIYHMSGHQLDRYRASVAVARTGAQLEVVIGDIRAAGVEIHGSDALKTAPKGYPKDHARIEYLRYKGIVATRSWEPGKWLLGTGDVVERVASVLRTSAPLVAWLDANVGPANEDG